MARQTLAAELRAELADNAAGCMLALSLFHVALLTSTNCATPLPPRRNDDDGGEWTAEQCREHWHQFAGSAAATLRSIAADGGAACSDELIALLHFVVRPRAYRERLLRPPHAEPGGDNCPPMHTRLALRSVDWFQSLSPAAALTAETRPDYVFECLPSDDDPFEALAALHGRTIEYHGSPMANCHSIVRRGLLLKYCKRTVYGDGLYFTSDIRVARNFVEPSDKLLLPDTFVDRPFGCLAVFEVLRRHPAVRRANAADAESAGLAVHAGGLPAHYVIAASPRYVRLRALLVYCQVSATGKVAARVSYLVYLYVAGLLLLALVGSTWPQHIRRFILRYLHA